MSHTNETQDRKPRYGAEGKALASKVHSAISSSDLAQQRVVLGESVSQALDRYYRKVSAPHVLEVCSALEYVPLSTSGKAQLDCVHQLEQDKKNKKLEWLKCIVPYRYNKHDNQPVQEKKAEAK